MTALRPHLHRFVWLALVAMLALALVPTLSRAAASGSPWDEICSVGTPADGEGAGDAAAMHLDHCALCALSAHAPLLPVGEVMPFAVKLAAAFVPALFAHSPRPLFAWSAARPRGPPARS